MTNPMLEKLVRFQHPDRSLGYARNLSDDTLAALFGTDAATYRAALDEIDAQRTQAARTLAADPSVAALLKRLPFQRGQRIVAIGESTTADRLSWFEILGTLIGTERPDLELRFGNLAVAGATTTQTLAAVPSIRRQVGDWVFCMLGTNDLQRFGSPDGPRLVSESETLRNLRELRARAELAADARWVWLTPTPVDDAAIDAFPFFGGAGIYWRNKDVQELSAALPTAGDSLIQTASAAGAPDAFLDDGVHPSLATQQRLASLVLAALAE
jgi:acyl-CoA thioesterase-1